MASKFWEWTGEKTGSQLATGDNAQWIAPNYCFANIDPPFARNDIGRNYYVQDTNLLAGGMPLQLVNLPGGGMALTTFKPI